MKTDEECTLFTILATTFTPTIILITGLSFNSWIITGIGLIGMLLTFISGVHILGDLSFCSNRGFFIPIMLGYITVMFILERDNSEHIRNYFVGLVFYFLIFIYQMSKDYETLFTLLERYLKEQNDETQND